MWRAWLAASALAAGLVGVPAALGGPSVAADSPGAQLPAANPAMVESCGSNVVLVLDASGSISSSHAVDNVRDAAESFLDALTDTGSTARVLQFASVSQQLAAQAPVTSASMRPGGAFRTAIDRYYNPLPPRPSGTTIFQYRGGDTQSPGSYREANSSTQYTNWDQSLDQANDAQPNPTALVVYVTDGDPTAFDFNQPGDPFDAGPPPDVATSTDTGNGAQTTLDRAVQEANLLKSAGTRMLAVGVGSAVTGNQSSRDRLIKIAGPQTVTDAQLPSIDSINQVDVALVKDFAKLATFLRGVVNQLCTPSLTVQKLAQTPGSTEYTPASDWQIQVQPTVAGGTYRWILPDSSATQRPRCGNPANPDDQASRSCATDATGFAPFQWEPAPSSAQSSAVVTEVPKPGYTPGRPGPNNDWTCTFKNDDGTATTTSGDFGTPALGFTLAVDPDQIITCKVYNSFDYAPAIALTKVDAPVQVRGDLPPPASSVTSTFEVTNPGNAPLAGVELVDDSCRPTLQSGDVDGDGLLATTETWQYTCTRRMVSSPGSPPLSITNHAVVTAVAPTGALLTDTAQDTVEVFAPAITLEKTASPERVEVGVPTPVTYTYVVTNTGNMTLNNVTITDTAVPVSATCAPIVPGSLPLLPPGASMTFTCSRALTASDPDDTFVNTATATADPAFPAAPAAAPPPVTAHATAVVTAFQTGLELTKSVDRSVVAPGTPVVYTYTVANTGSVPLVRIGAPGSPDPRDGWILDAFGPTGTCAPVVFDSSDGNDDAVLDAGETWTYTCDAVVSGAVAVVKNTAVVVARTIDDSAHLTAFAQATVEVVAPTIALDKEVLTPVVLDPAAPATAGPDTPDPRPAQFVFTVRNTGNVPVRNVVVTDSYAGSATKPCVVQPVLTGGRNVGDVLHTGALDPGEAWRYTCELDGADALTKEDGDDPADPVRPATVTDTAGATAEAFFLDGATEYTAPVTAGPVTGQVVVIEPRISLAKIPCVDSGGPSLACDPTLLVRPGTDVTYRYLLTNTGDSPVRPLRQDDDRCPVLEYVDGDLDDDGMLDPGVVPETWEYHCTAEVTLPSPVTNTAVALVVGPLGNLYQATAQATVRLFEPAIRLTKSVSSDLVAAGSTVTYEFHVSNAGVVADDGVPADVVLSQVGLLDVSSPANPSCTNPAFVGGDGNANGTLDLVPAEVWRYRCTGVITERTVDAAGVSASDILGGTVVDFDTATVTPFVTGIDVTKTAVPARITASGNSVVYGYQVTNTGNVPLAAIDGRVTDDKCAPVTPVTAGGFNIGDLDQNGVLTGDADLFETGGFEVWSYTCTMPVLVDTVNTVTVVGTPVQPVDDVSAVPPGQLIGGAFQVLAPDVTDQAQALVTVIPPATTTTAGGDSGAGLPSTGGDTLPLVYLSLLALGAGIGAVRLGRRARS